MCRWSPPNSSCSSIEFFQGRLKGSKWKRVTHWAAFMLRGIECGDAKRLGVSGKGTMSRASWLKEFHQIKSNVYLGLNTPAFAQRFVFCVLATQCRPC